MALYEKGDKKVIRGWMMYDWANSVYNLVITSAIFPMFYEAVTKGAGVERLVNGHKQVFVNFLGTEIINTTLINYVSAFGFLIVAFLSPLLSGMADYVGRKKMFLRIFAYMGSFSCMGLYFFDVNEIHWGLLFYLTALIGFWGSLVFYNAYLPEIAHKKDHDKISAGGFSMGYIGSVILLSLCLVLIQVIGRDAQEAFLLTGLWWFGFSHIFFARLKESKEKYKASRKVLFNGFKELKKVYGELKENVVLKRYLRAFFVYSMGVQTVMLVAVYFAAKEIEWGEGGKTTGLILSILLIQLVTIYVGRKKKFLRIFIYMVSFSCMGLYFFDVNEIHWGLLFYLTALICFWESLVFFNAYLPEIGHKKNHDKISAGSFAMGYIVSLLLLSLYLVLIQIICREPQEAFLLTGLWWFGFSYIFFVRLKESKEKYKASRKVLLNGFRELKKVYGELKENVVLKRYLRAFFVYSMGVQTVMLVAVYFAAKEIQWEEGTKTMGLILSILLIQLVAILGAFSMSKLSSKIGNIKTLQVVVLMWAGLAFWAYFIVTPMQFYLTAGIVGLVMGGVQSMSRSTYSKFIPETKDTSSYFSFFDVTEKIGIVIGMAMFAFLENLTGSMRNSILVITVFFIVGFILLAFVPKDAEKEK